MREKIQKEIEKRIALMQSGYVFSAKDFADISTQDAANQALSRLDKEGRIRRIIRGFYYVAEYSELIGEYSAPRMDMVAEAMARKFNWSIAPSGNTALNMLGLSTQVPFTWSYVSDGPNREYDINSNILTFKRVKQSEISGFHRITVTVIQAIRAIGREYITSKHKNILKNNLSCQDKKIVLSESKIASSWIVDIIKEICAGEK